MLTDISSKASSEAIAAALRDGASSLSHAVQALLAHWQQTDRLLALSMPGVAALAHTPLMPETLQGIEAISPMQTSDQCYPSSGTLKTNARSAFLAQQQDEVHGFTFSLTALSTDAQLKAADFIGQRALIELQTVHSREVRRPLSGVVTAFACLGANGGLARYELIIKPWLWWLSLRSDSYLFTDASVLDIVESVLADYQSGAQGELIRWRIDVADRSVYPLRSVTTQYQETDLHLLTRLLVEEGLCYYFEHAADGHTLVITDAAATGGGNTENAGAASSDSKQAVLRFTQSSSSTKDDSVDRWQVKHHLLPSRIQLQSWDYRSLSTRPVESVTSENVPQLTLQLEPGMYAYVDRDHGQRLADTILQSFNARRLVVHARSTVRTLSPATTFTLTDHYQAGDELYAVLAVSHVARNNVDVKLGANQAGIVASLLPLANRSIASRALPAPASSSSSSFSNADDVSYAEGDGPAEHYRNHFIALPKATAYKPASTAHGKALYSRPSATGTQTAVVVGDDDRIHTDRDHRVQIQYHWQRGANSSSALSHPSDEDNATARSKGISGGLWVRVATADAGSNYGSVFIPRVGQEVIVAFLGNDIDRPLIIGAAYNGEGAADAQHNQVSQGNVSATGNAAAWFAGEQGAHAHRAALSGIKTQALSASQSGHGAYNQLVFDDTPEHGGARLQTTQSSSQLNLGSLWHQQDNQRQANRGYGAELTTQHSGAIRGGGGVLISSEAASPQSEQLQSNALSPLQQAQSNAKALNQHATQQRATLAGFDANNFDEQLIKQLSDKLTTTNTGASNSNSSFPLPQGEGQGEGGPSSSFDTLSALQPKAIGGGSGEVTAYSHPVMVLSSPAGIAHFSAKDTIELTGQHRHSNSADSTLTVQGNSLHHSAEGQVWYTAGQAPITPRAIQDVGMKLHAATGNVQLRALTSTTDINADQSILIASTQSTVKLTAPAAKLMLTAAGAAITLEQGKLTLTAPGNITLSASQVIYTDAGNASDSVSLPKGSFAECPTHLIAPAAAGASFI
jgi:Rhs element Vgr protein